MPIKANKKGKTSIWRSLFNVLNFSDFFVELWHSVRFGVDRLRGKPYTRTDARFGKFDIAAAFGAEGQGNSSVRGDQSPLARSESRFEMEEHSKAGKKDEATFDPNSSSGFSSNGNHNSNNNGYLHPNSPRSEYTNRSSFNDSDTLGSLNSSSIGGLGASGFQSRRRPSFDPHPLSKNTIREDEDYHVGLLDQGQTQSTPRSNNNNNQLNPVSPYDLINMPGKAELGRLSPSPRSPRDSSGRYPSFLYDSNQVKDTKGIDSFNRSRSTSPNPNGREREIIRQPSPNQPGSWNETPYRVSGFPRDSYIETDNGYQNQNQNGPPQKVHPNALYPNQYHPVSNQYHPQQQQQPSSAQRQLDQQLSSSRLQLQQLSQSSSPQQNQSQQSRSNNLQPSFISQNPQPPPDVPLPTAPLSIPNKMNKSNPNLNVNINNSQQQPADIQSSSSTIPEIPIHIPPPRDNQRPTSTQFINQTGFRDSLFVPEARNEQRPNSLISSGNSESGDVTSSVGHETLKSRPGSWEPQAL